MSWRGAIAFLIVLVLIAAGAAPDSPAWARSITIPTFDFRRGKAEIPEASMPLVDYCAVVFRQHPEIDLVETRGHTDGREKGDLGIRRAETVVAALVARGVAPEQLVARGYGATKPVCKKNNDDCRATNRRVDFVFVRMR